MLPFVFLRGIPAFLLVVPLGFVVWQWGARRNITRYGHTAEQFADATYTGALIAVFFGHFLDLVFYHPDELLRAPLSVFKIWNGLSSFGGFVGTAVAAWFWKFYDLQWTSLLPKLERRRTPMEIWPFAEASLPSWCSTAAWPPVLVAW